MIKDILFVCTGNTCRSPMAMAIFNALSQDSRAASAGLQVGFPQSAAENARIAVKKYGGNLEGHTSRQLTFEDLEKYSLIITMTASQKQMLRSIYNDEKIITLAEFAGENADIQDPYGGSLMLYEDTAKMIYDYLKKGMKEEFTFAQTGDAQEIEQLEKQSFSDAWSINSIQREINQKRIIIIKDNNEILGYCIFMIAADEGEILRIAVKENMRKRGIGKNLIISAVSEMKNKGCKGAFLEVRASNSAAIKLYKSTGFEEIGIRKGYYADNHEDAVLFKLEIKER